MTNSDQLFKYHIIYVIRELLVTRESLFYSWKMSKLLKNSKLKRLERLTYK